MRLILNIYFIFFTISALGQIWDYPPSSYTEQNVLKGNYISVRKIETYKSEIRNGKETGIKQLEYFKEYDVQGNLILEVIDSGDSTVYGNYNSGFWGFKKMANQDTIFQNVIFDLNGKVIYHSTYNPNIADDSLITTSKYDDKGKILSRNSNGSKFTWNYNNGNDSIIKEFPPVLQSWEYIDQKIINYSKYENNTLVESRTFSYNHDTISYITTFYSNGKPYPISDTTIGVVNSNNEVLHVMSYTDGEKDPYELKSTYNEKGELLILQHGCKKFLYEYNKEGRLIKIESYNCEGELFNVVLKEYYLEK
ncbi:hypothetical protein K6119_04195 [Paracrocinitomix mangrovi]|uniref:hypothetical protein n=1 Tax=Paracrocinitomix mangrovi TaxID=2862509 RepID=UPI001C8DCCCB|nr:hypothetical protein [Paracrocinitomix mangrovi]UKN02714.1 hypothetical protein K6119_04195 [Paracrocinitomix mangrovi]